MKNIIIVGGGFGGIYTAKYLASSLKERKDIKITLINKKNYFLFTPMLHEVATGGLNRHNIVEPIRAILKNKNFSFVEDEVQSVDLAKKKVICSSCDITYDYLVLAVGSSANFFDIPGAKEYALDLKDLSGAARVRNKIISSMESASKYVGRKDIRPCLNMVVVGAGPTGVEIAGEIAEFTEQMLRDNYKEIREKGVNIYLLQKGNIILPFIHPECREQARIELEKKNVKILLSSEVTRVTKDSVEINRNTKISSMTVIWTSGVKPNNITTAPKITNDRGFFEVNEYLQVKGQKNVFALGDCALFFNQNEKKPVPALAQTAAAQAKYAAKNIMHALNGESMEACRVRLKGFLVSVGQKFAVAEIDGIRFKGFFAWWLWRTIYLFKLVGKANKVRVAFEWTMNFFSKRDTSRI